MYFSLENVLQGLSQYEVIHPVKVNSAGNFISNCVSHHVSRIQRRETSTGSPAQVFYSLFFGGQSLYFNLTLNPHLLAPGFVTERRNGGGMHGSKLFSPNQSICYFLGEVLGDGKVKGQAAISTCDGLTGLFKLAADDFFIKPLEPAQGETVQQAHVIYRRRVSLENSRREYWESQKRKKRRRRILQRSISREKWVETLVVADSKMVEYHGKGVENYVLSVMNIVAGLFRDASIGNAINIVVVRLILLEQDEEALKITHHADHSLSSFCKWQKRLNPKGDDQPLHHDVAVLLTSRKDICALINSPCETLGLSHVAGMCQPHRSCSINEDTGLPVSFTVAHELGHNFGIQHDGNGNDCEPVGKKPFIMSPQLLYGSTPNWSQCSRQYITRFLDRGWGWCLDDPPVQDKLTTHTVLPGVLYTAAHQCRLQYGSGSLLCDEMDNICSTLWCTVGSTCHSKLDGAVDGTKCGEGKWCYSGECISIGSTPERVNGGWGQWSKWSACSRTCGMGVQNAQRDCTNPAPQHRGRYCLGERLRYRICSTDPCPPDQPGFRYVQCGQFNSTPYKGKLYEWVHVNNRVNLCELHCRPLEENFSEKMRDAVIDGTPCYEGSASRDICINGICKSVGCDYQIDSNAIEDRCGVCHGNGSTCETVTRMFERSEGQGYVDVALIPAGARDIRIMEVAESGNFLALRSSDPDKYFLNGGWTIQWTGDYKAAGTVFTYERTGNLENLTSPGPTMEPLWVQLLFQEMNPGVRYEYTISKDRPPDSNSSLPESDFQWVNGTWTECSVTCGTGVKQQAVHCIEMTSGIVEPHYCDSSTRPHDKWVTCKQKACPSIWWAGEWQKCSASCGKDGLTKRTVLCIQSVGQEEQRALQPSECQHLPRPKPISPCNTDIHCPASWSSGNWSECSVTCSHGLQRRDVFCLRDSEGDCDEKMKPDSVQSCHMEDCLSEVDVIGGDWSGSGSSSNEVLSEINSIPEDNSVPTFAIGTTRAQPKGPNDVNNIMNEGVIYSNHIHKTSDNAIKNILVDDFYYDYNFIKFHEDLYDFGTDNEGTDPMDESGIGLINVELDNCSNIDCPTATSFVTETSTVFLRPENEENDHLMLHPGDTESAEIPQDNVSKDLLLSQDYLLPVFTTQPLKSVTRFFQHWKLIDNQDSPSPTEMTIFNDPNDPFPFHEYDLETNIITNFPDWTQSTYTSPTASSSVQQHDISSKRQEIEAVTNDQLPDSPTIFSQSPEAPHTSLDLSIQSGHDQHTTTDLDIMLQTTSAAQADIRPSFTISQYVTVGTSTPDSGQVLMSFPDSSPGGETARWTAGNWSACSTSCGLGATWRSIICSSGNSFDCELSKRPAPARRCYLRPCSAWRTGNWNKCSRNCSGGVMQREVQCYDIRTGRSLRPFHCQAISSRPAAHTPCNSHPCMDWYTSSWGQCSELCGGGEQQRLVACPESEECDVSTQPSHIQPCNTHTCSQWVTGSWGQCSVSCGGGIQRRLVKCVNSKAEPGKEEEEDEQLNAQCDHEASPENMQQCNMQDCDTSQDACLHDRLGFRFCQSLRWLGRCRLPSVQEQCCRTCLHQD
uniref:A disintegrin and metalloproteinase with thrombospondin motifs 7 n=1 Tax=Denticeps clupeoides TaxID=299321 RepID=A0AAY4CEZ3_9TELE